jgi:flagellar motility protein MotE (MotC chaperone)
MKSFKKLLVSIMVMSLTIHPAFLDCLLAAHQYSVDDENLTLPEYSEPYQNPQDAIVEPPEPPEPPPPPPPPPPEPPAQENNEEEKAAAPETNEEDAPVVLASAGDVIDLNDGTKLTEQSDGTYKDEDGNKWIKSGDDQFMQLGFPAGNEITLNDENKTKLTSTNKYEINEDGTFPDLVWFTDEDGNRWDTFGGGFHQIDYKAQTEIPLSDGTVLKNDAAFTANNDGTFPGGVKLTDADGNRWVTTTEGAFQRIDVPANTEFKLTDGTTVLKNTTKFAYNDDGSIPDKVWFTDQDNNRWVTLDGGKFQQIDYKANSTITLSDGVTILTNTAAYSRNDDGTMPDKVWFTDQNNNRWESLGGGLKQIDYPANSKIPLSDGTILTNAEKFSYNDDGTLPDGIKFTDDKGNKWVSRGGQFARSEFQAQTTSIPLANGSVLTNAVPYELNADGTIPEGVLFTDQNGALWVSAANGQYNAFDPSKTPYSSLAIVKKLQGMNSADASALLATFNPGIAGLLMFGADGTTKVFTDQQISDMLKGMGTDSAATIVDLFSSFESRVPAVLGIMDPVAAGKILSSDKVRAMAAAYLLTQAGISRQQAGAILNNMDPGHAAQMANLFFLVGIQPIIHKDGAIIVRGTDGTRTTSPNPLPGTQNDFLTVPLGPEALAQISAFRAALGYMDPAKAAAIFANPDMSLTTAAKALYGMTGRVIGNDGDYNIYNNPSGEILAALGTLDPGRAQSINEILAHYKADAAGNVLTRGMTYDQIMSDTTRPLTAAEKEYYTTIFGWAPQSVKETFFQDTLNREFIRYNPGQYITENVAYGTQTVGAQGLGAERYYIKGVLSLGISGTTVDLAGKIAALSPTDAAKFLKSTDSATAAAILGDSRMVTKIGALSSTEAADFIKSIGVDSAAATILASGSVTVDKANEILGLLGKDKAGTILNAMDKTNAIKADAIRVKQGIDPDLSTMTADKVAEYLATLDPAKAAVKLERMGLENQIADFFKNNLGREPTAAEKDYWLTAAGKDAATLGDQMYRSVRGTAEYQAFAKQKITDFYKIILGRDPSVKEVSDWLWGTKSEYLDWSLEEIKMAFLGSAEFQAKTDKKTLAEYNALLGENTNAGARITEILASDKLTTDQASKILSAMIDLATTVVQEVVPGSGGEDTPVQYTSKTVVDTNLVAQILSWKSTDEAATFKGLSIDQAAAFLAGLGAEKAALVLNNNNMSVETAGAMLAKVQASNAQEVTDILTLLDKANKTKSDQVRAAIGAVPGKMGSDSSAQYLTTLDPVVAAAELAKLTPDQAVEILISPEMTLAAGEKILKATAADKEAAYISSTKMSVEMAVAILTKLKISDVKKYTDIMAQLALDTVNKDKIGQITTAMDKVPSSQKISSVEQSRLQGIYGAAPAFSTKEVIAGVNGAPESESWKYYDADGNVIGTRIVSNPGTYYEDGEGGYTTYGGYSATYYDISGKAITSQGGGFQKLSADKTKQLADVFQGVPVYTKTSHTFVQAGGAGGGVTEYYDENFKLLGTQGYSTRYAGVQGFITTLGGFKDKNGNEITAGEPQRMSNGGTKLINTDTATRTVTAGSEEETKLKAIFGIIPAIVHEYKQSYWWNGLGGTSNGEGFNAPAQWASKGLITGYYDAAGNYLGSKRTTTGTNWMGEVYSVDQWYDRNGDSIA